VTIDNEKGDRVELFLAGSRVKIERSGSVIANL